ncbi:hypothetical protein BD626DRAFT_402514 [Schizophyllum amplum]|uniref:HNH nuclease domain-containing protein n=1 Tax=Schizophyllum amplum TaxID=97359 RepID=A0A550CFD1_9AGAR|nr:hypothetical protein BD626DRAFT_402514 [Auriculariopsis ampla]
MQPVPSQNIYTSKNVEACTIVSQRVVCLDVGHYRQSRQIQHFEYYWGLQKGDIDLASPLNHIQLRSDMAQSLLKDQWTFMPTQETLRIMLEISKHNQTADLQSRRRCFQELPDAEYEYDVVPLWMVKHGRPVLYAEDGAKIKAMRAPYKDLPRITSRTHPFFVAFMASGQLDRCAPILYSDKKSRSLTSTVGCLIMSWLHEPPTAFLVGPDIWKTHRHPLSDDGHAARSALRDSRKRITTKEVRMRKTIHAPCRQQKSAALTTPYTRCDMRPARARGSVLPRSGVESGQEGSMGYDLSDLREWLADIAPHVRSDPVSWDPTWLEQETVTDEELARYRQEVIRDAYDALHPQTTVNGGGLLIGTGVDRSRYSSNTWAMRTFDTCLWADDPYVHIKLRP